MRIVFTKRAIGDIAKLDASIRVRVKGKLFWFSEQKNPLKFAKKLKGDTIGLCRFRIGDYRVFFDLKDQILFIHRIGHRREIY